MEKEKSSGSPIRMSETPTAPSASAPELGQHTEEILIELGYTWERLANSVTCKRYNIAILPCVL